LLHPIYHIVDLKLLLPAYLKKIDEDNYFMINLLLIVEYLIVNSPLVIHFSLETLINIFVDIYANYCRRIQVMCPANLCPRPHRSLPLLHRITFRLVGASNTVTNFTLSFSRYQLSNRPYTNRLDFVHQIILFVDTPKFRLVSSNNIYNVNRIWISMTREKLYFSSEVCLSIVKYAEQRKVCQ
jgi:hypothetical protein